MGFVSLVVVYTCIETVDILDKVAPMEHSLDKVDILVEAGLDMIGIPAMA